jgi:hypothetical protein
MAYAKGKEQNSILNPNNINENFKIIVVDFIANLKSAIYSKQVTFNMADIFCLPNAIYFGLITVIYGLFLLSVLLFQINLFPEEITSSVLSLMLAK